MPLITYEPNGEVAVLRMDDGKANALGYAFMDELDASLDRAEREASAVVLAGRMGRFSAGFDLSEMMAGLDRARALVARGATLLMRLYGYPLPLVAACTGHALAGGALTLLTADVRIAARGAYKIGLNEVQIGMPLPILAVELARDRLRPEHFQAATLFATIVNPEEALEAGWVDALADDADVVSLAVARAAALAKLPREAYAKTKVALRERTMAYVKGTLAMDMARVTLPMTGS